MWLNSDTSATGHMMGQHARVWPWMHKAVTGGNKSAGSLSKWTHPNAWQVQA
jgi:hypothetical protein